MAIVNEYDPVTRADTDYVHSLLELHQSGLLLQPARESELQHGSTSTSNSSDSEKAAIEALREDEEGETTKTPPQKVWKLPKPLMFNVGELMVLKDSNSDEDGLNLSAIPVTAEEFSQFLFCKIEAHRRKAYLRTVGELRAGRFNGKNGW